MANPYWFILYFIYLQVSSNCTDWKNANKKKKTMGKHKLQKKSKTNSASCCYLLMGRLLFNLVLCKLHLKTRNKMGHALSIATNQPTQK